MTLYNAGDKVADGGLWYGDDKVAVRWYGADEVYRAGAAPPPGPAGTLVTLTVGFWPGFASILGYHSGSPAFGSSDVTSLHGRTLVGFFWGAGMSGASDAVRRIRMVLAGASSLDHYPDSITIEDQNGVIRTSTSRELQPNGADVDFIFGVDLGTGEPGSLTYDATLIGDVGDTQKIWA